MAKLTKNRKISIEKVDSEKSYTLEEASSLVKEITTTKFDSSVDLAIRLGVDPRKANEMVRGVVSLPHGTCLLYTSPSPRDATLSRMPSSA